MAKLFGALGIALLLAFELWTIFLPSTFTYLGIAVT
jgi:hypothetical protein